jgi:hypothetical protein
MIGSDRTNDVANKLDRDDLPHLKLNSRPHAGHLRFIQDAASPENLAESRRFYAFPALKLKGAQLPLLHGQFFLTLFIAAPRTLPLVDRKMAHPGGEPCRITIH